MITPAARFYLGFYRDVLWRLLVFSVADILQPFVLILILVIVRYSIDKLIAHGKLLQLLFMILGIIGLYLISGGVNLLVRYFSLHITDGPIQQFHEEILKRVYSFSRQYYTWMDRKQLHTILVRDMTQADTMINATVGLDHRFGHSNLQESQLAKVDSDARRVLAETMIRLSGRSAAGPGHRDRYYSAQPLRQLRGPRRSTVRPVGPPGSGNSTGRKFYKANKIRRGCRSVVSRIVGCSRIDVTTHPARSPAP